MKKLINLLVVFIHTSLIAQINDSVSIKCMYNLTVVSDTNNPIFKNKDVKILEIGKNSSKYYSYLRNKGDSAMKADVESGANIAEILANKYKYHTDKSSLIVYHNYPTSLISVTEDIGQMYLYTEELKTQKWKIEADTQTFIGLNCTKAISNFRGRNYIAWFTYTIPTTFGPWKFNGLPGLILKIYDEQNHYTFECTSIEDGKMKPINKYALMECIKITRKEMRKLIEERFVDPLGSFIGNSNGVNVSFNDPNLDIPKRPFNPIERTYD